VGVLTSGALVAGAWVTPAAAADGKVDVAVGTKVVLENASIKRAAARAARLCGGEASDFTEAAHKADRTGKHVIVCTAKGSKKHVSFRS
jgi:hypothetical protein